MSAANEADELDLVADGLEAQARFCRALAAERRRRAGGETMLTPAAAAKKIGRSTRYVRDEIREGRLEAHGRGRVIMIAPAALDAWIAAQPARPVRADVTESDGLAVETSEADVDARIAEMGTH